MITKKFLIISILIIFLTSNCKKSDYDIGDSRYQKDVISVERALKIPQLKGYITLRCDLHVHTTYSDGSLTPVERIDEALKDELDAIAITDHVEFAQNYRSWVIAEEYARDKNILIIRGAEISKQMPPGHFNALFINNPSTILKDSIYDSALEVIKQGGVFIWNHPGSVSQQPDGIAKLYPIHQEMINKGMIHGIEISTCAGVYPQVFNFLTENMSILANSDAHLSIYEDIKATRRPITIVLAKEKSLYSIKEAIIAGRTIAFFDDTFAGKEENIRILLRTCISIAHSTIEGQDDKISLEITNSSNIPFLLNNNPSDLPDILLPHNSTTKIVLDNDIKLYYDVNNLLIGESECLRINLACPDLCSD